VLALTLVPVVVFGGLELGLRLGGYGYPTTFFLESRINGRKVFVENDQFGFRFFTPALARSPAPTILPAFKPANTCRIFILGESAALGDPEPAFGFGRYLEVLLRERFAPTHFEVFRAAVTAINSHALVPIARECSRHEGDLWVLYMGNNEVVGPFGAGTVLGWRAPPLWMVRATLALKATRVGQLLDAGIERATGGSGGVRSWEGMKMFLNAQTRPDDPSRKRTNESFRKNLEEILRTTQKAGAKVVLSTVACNLKDCAPFASVHSRKLTEAQLAAWEQLYRQGMASEEAGSWRQAVEKYAGAAALDGEFAELQFRLGRCYLALTNEDQARRCLELARDFDALAFRTDSRLNAIIREVGEKFGGKAVRLMEAEEALSPKSRIQSPQSAVHAPRLVPGDEVFYEHVHLNFEGNYLLARAVAEQVAALLPPKAFGGHDSGQWATAEVCNRQLCVSPWDRRRVYEDILEREREPPFTLQADHSSHVKRLSARLKEINATLGPQARQQARELYRQGLPERPEDFLLRSNFGKLLEDIGDYAGALGEWERVEQLLPYHFGPSFYVGRLLARLGRYSEAERELNKTLRLWPNVPEALDELGQIRLKQKRPAEAVGCFEQALRLQPGNARLHLRLAEALGAQEKRDEAMASLRQAVQLRPDYWEARYFLGVELAVRGQVQEAANQFSEVVRLRPDYAPAHLNLGVALAKQNRLEEARAEFRETLRLAPTNKSAQEYLSRLEARPAPAPR